MTDLNEPRKRRRLTSFSLRTALIAVTVLAVWLGLHMNSVRKQRASIEAVRQLGGEVWYDFQVTRPDGYDRESESPIPGWVLKKVGPDHFHDVIGVWTGRRFVGAATAYEVDSVFSRITGFPDLEVLMIGDVYPVSDHGLREISSLERLRWLAIESGSEITDNGVRQLEDLKKLQTVSFRSSNLTDDSLEVLCDLPRLEQVCLLDGQFTDEGVKCISGMPQLVRLELGNDAGVISDAGLKVLARLPDLKDLVLHGSRFTEDGLRELVRLEKLESVTIQGSSVDAGWLSQRLPQCYIVIKQENEEGWIRQSWFNGQGPQTMTWP